METGGAPLQIRKLLIRQAIIVSVVVLVIGLILTALSGSWGEATGQLGWALAFSVGVGVFTLWQTASKVRKGFIDATNPRFALVPVRREEYPGIDWKTIDDYASRFEALGFRRLGEFTPNKPAVGVRGVALVLSDPEDERIVEVQHFERTAPTPLMGDEHFTPKIAIGSIAGGRVRVMVSDRPVLPAMYMVRGEAGVYASYPGMSAFELLDKHRKLTDFVAERSGKTVDRGLTLERYVMLQRETQAQVKARFEQSGAWSLIDEFDAFTREPKSSFATDPAYLKSLPTRDWREIDATAIDAAAATAAAPEATEADLALRQRMESGASWFYWIAGLSLVNTVSEAMGSTWGFVIGLGLTQLLGAGVLTLLVICGFAFLGWVARRPSVAAFTIGIALFGLDTLLFIAIGDWIGIAFHGLALYFLWSGLGAARAIKRQAEARGPGAAASA